MYYHPQYQYPLIDRQDWSEEQLLRDIVYLLRRPNPFIIEPAATIIEHVQRQIEAGAPEPWKLDNSDFPDCAVEMAYALLVG